MYSSTELRDARDRSLKRLAAIGCSTSPPLPLLGGDEPRMLEEIVDRALILEVLVSVSEGLPNDAGLDWLVSDGLMSKLESDEVKFLEMYRYDALNSWTSTGPIIHSLFTLTWVLSLFDSADFERTIPDELASKFPSIELTESSNEFRQSCKLADRIDILSFADFAYCLHWWEREKSLRGMNKSPYVPDFVVRSRRHAIEWVLSNDSWSSVSLDT
jgi:hypothetical protein